jgi:hypothetical protein
MSKVEYGLSERIAEKLPSGVRGLLIKELNEVAKLEAENAFLELANEAYEWMIRRFANDDQGICCGERPQSEGRTVEQTHPRG